MVAQFPRLIDYLCADQDLKQVPGRLSAHVRACVSAICDVRTYGACVRECEGVRVSVGACVCVCVCERFVCIVSVCARACVWAGVCFSMCVR